jgi:citrate lyase subunit beta / citryl-CoA lyase
MTAATTYHLMRSLLFLPANQEKFYVKAADLPADGYVVDLEDSVPESEKTAARKMMSVYAPRLAEAGAVWARVNAHQSAHFAADIAAVTATSAIGGLMLPKIETVDDLRQIDAMLARSEAEHGRAAGAIRLLLIIESARAAWLAYDLATASPRVASLCFGGARDGDLMTDLGADWSNDGSAMLYARQRVLLAARAAGCAVPLDSVFADLRDREGFERDTRLSRSLGFRGRAVIHPSQIETANRIYAPTPDEIATSRRLIEAFEKAAANGRASTMFEGRMIDIAMANAARAILSAAQTTTGDQKSSS